MVLRLPCEIVVREILPVLRAIIARELVEKHGYTQTRAAEALGVSQASISHYLALKRGKAAWVFSEAGEIAAKAAEAARMLAEESIDYQSILRQICEVCRSLRAKGVICEAHKGSSPRLRNEECKVCMDTESR